MQKKANRADRGVPVRYLVPNLITTISLCCGLAAIHFAIKAAFPTTSIDETPLPAGRFPRFNNWDRALIGVMLAAIFDALDGRAARLLRVSSRFGEVLDSLSDFVCFGVAPALILYLWGLREEEVLGFAAVVCFTLCSAFRLARFTSTVAVRGDQSKVASILKNYFTGCPTPAAAAAVLIPIMIVESKQFEWYMPPWGVILWTFFLAWLMISRRPMFSFKRIRVPRKAVVPALVVVGLLVALAAKDPWLAATLLAGSYVFSLPLAMLLYHRSMSQEGVRGAASWSAGLSVREQIRRARQESPA
jgi:CDP-diacylglycerol---serine O-phosphatidyltransferase